MFGTFIAASAVLKLTHFIRWLVDFLRKQILTYVPSYCEYSVRGKLHSYGVEIDGTQPCDIQVHDSRFYREVAHDAAMGLGESYMYGYWSPNNFPAFFDRILKDGDKFFDGTKGRKLWQAMAFKILHLATFNVFTIKPAPTAHYSKDVYSAFLGSTMSFSCGYWKNASNLEEAQLHKMELLARKLKIKPGMTVLDIGCGWGTLTKYLAAKYGAKIVGCTLHEEQGEFAKRQCVGLYVDIKVVHCESIRGKFDRIISVGRLGFVGRANYRRFFRFVHRCLKDDGILLLDTIGVAEPNVRLSDPWTQKYLLPGLEYPYQTDIPISIDGLFVLEDWANLGFHYSTTLEAWLTNLEQPKLKQMFGSQFYRMWQLYLHRQAAYFRNRKLQLWQFVMSKRGVAGGYDTER